MGPSTAEESLRLDPESSITSSASCCPQQITRPGTQTPTSCWKAPQGSWSRSLHLNFCGLPVSCFPLGSLCLFCFSDMKQLQVLVSQGFVVCSLLSSSGPIYSLITMDTHKLCGSLTVSAMPKAPCPLSVLLLTALPSQPPAFLLLPAVLSSEGCPPAVVSLLSSSGTWPSTVYTSFQFDVGFL